MEDSEKQKMEGVKHQVLKRQLAKDGLVGDGEPAGAEVADVVGASGEAVGSITAPEASVGETRKLAA